MEAEVQDTMFPLVSKLKMTLCVMGHKIVWTKKLFLKFLKNQTILDPGSHLQFLPRTSDFQISF